MSEFHGAEAGVELMIPPLFDAMWALTAVVVLIPRVIAVVSIARHREGLSSAALVGWLIPVSFVQLIGPALWFLLGRPHTRSRMLAPVGRATAR